MNRRKLRPCGAGKSTPEQEHRGLSAMLFIQAWTSTSDGHLDDIPAFRAKLNSQPQGLYAQARESDDRLDVFWYHFCFVCTVCARRNLRPKEARASSRCWSLIDNRLFRPAVGTRLLHQLCPTGTHNGTSSFQGKVEFLQGPSSCEDGVLARMALYAVCGGSPESVDSRLVSHRGI